MQSAYLIGTHIVLRPLEARDADAFAVWLNDARVTRTLRYRRPITRADELEFIERVGKDEHSMLLGIVIRKSNRLIGSTGLMRIDWQARSAGFGIHIGLPSEWGKGYGGEATRLVVAHAFETMNLHRVWLDVHADNAAGRRAYQRAGFRLEGTQRQAAYREGVYRDVHFMAILRSEWEACQRTKGSAEPRPRTAAARPRARRLR